MTYANSLSGAFVLDDQSTIVDNQTIREWARPSIVLVPEPSTAIAGRPIVNASFALNYAIHGLDVRGYHVANIAVHLACALLAFGILRRTLGLPRLQGRFDGSSVQVAFAVALFWTVHPLNSEVVDYLTERTESLMAMFYLSTLYASIRAIPGRVGPSSRSPDRRWPVIALLSCVLGMASKETMVTAPIVVLLYDRVFVFDSFGQAVRGRTWLYLGLAASWVVLLGLMASGPRAAVGGFSTGVPVWTWLLNQSQMIAHYLRLVFWPRSLIVFYGWPLSLTLTDVLPFAGLVTALLVLTLVGLVRWPMFGFAGAWFFLTLAPTSSIVPIATEVGAERRMYLPLLAVIALFVVAAALLWRRWGGSGIGLRGRGALVAVVLTVFVAAPLAATTIARNREYESALALARTVVARRPTAVTRHYLAEQLSLAGLHDEAITHLRDAVAGGDSRAGYLLGIELFNAGKLDDAVRTLNGFVRTAQLPYRLVPRWLEPPPAEIITARLILARIASMQARWPEAATLARLVLGAAPRNREAQLFLADALFAQQQFEKAAAEYRTYLASRSDDARALTNLGISLIADGRLDEAIGLFRRAVASEPRKPDWRRILGMALMDRGDFEGAASQARDGLQLSPSDAALQELLARASTAGTARR